MIIHILIVIGLVFGYAGFCLLRPSGKCWRCFGHRMLQRKPPANLKGGKLPKRYRPRRCWVCKGKGWAPTPGASIVHALFWELAGDRVRGRLRDQVQATRDELPQCRCVLEGSPNPLCPLHAPRQNRERNHHHA